MKYINKGSEPQSFTKWKDQANEYWQPTFNELSGSEKKDVKDSLILEQRGICCYCERKLINNDSHIEHLKPQRCKEGQLNFSNFLCSCQKKLEKGEPQHCGNSKGSDILHITPLQKNCEKKFTYTEDGYIDCTDNDSKSTIKTLQLNIDKLNDLRRSAIDPFISDTLTEKQMNLFVTEYLNQHNEFYTTIQYLFKTTNE